MNNFEDKFSNIVKYFKHIELNNNYKTNYVSALCFLFIIVNAWLILFLLFLFLYQKQYKIFS